MHADGRESRLGHRAGPQRQSGPLDAHRREMRRGCLRIGAECDVDDDDATDPEGGRDAILDAIARSGATAVVRR